MERFSASSRSFLKFFSFCSNYQNPKTVIKMSISPSNNFLACIHLCGEISLWRMPGILLQRRWSLHEQPQYNKSKIQKIKENSSNEDLFYPFDIGWWSDNVRILINLKLINFYIKLNKAL